MAKKTEKKSAGFNRLVEVSFDERSIVKRNPDIEHERKVALFDLLEENVFSPVGETCGPYRLRLMIEDNRLIFNIMAEDGDRLGKVTLPLTPFRPIVKDYFLICESYYSAVKTQGRAQIEAIDGGRRGLHNEGAEILMKILEGKIDMDFDTARRLFTLICVLHIRG